MQVSLIVAMDEKSGIGRDGRLPWRLATDLKRFKALTMGHHLVIGRKTFESIGKPLPGRTNIVVTRQVDYLAEGCLVAHSLPDALALAEKRGETEVFIIGGGEIFAQALPFAGRIYLTRVQVEAGADVFFPLLDERDWIAGKVESYPATGQDQYAHTYNILDRCG
jgi:dihydrofolate reductase